MKQKPCELFSNAKINLTLDITGTDGGVLTGELTGADA